MDRLRAEAYGGAASGAIGGIFGLAISYSIAAGTVEGKLIPELREKMAEVKNFHDRVKSRIDEATRALTETEGKLKAEIKHIEDLKSQTEATDQVVQLDSDPVLADEIKNAVTQLIDDCNAYRRRHGGH